MTDHTLVGMTVDGGPYPRHTPAIVDALVRQGARATFFLVGFTAHVYPDEVCAVRDAGMELGNHTMNHRNLTSLTTDERRAEIVRCNEVIARVSGVRPRLFRPPWGEQLDDLPGIVDELGMEVIPVRGGTGDFHFPPVEELADRIVTTAVEGDLITLHSHVPEAAPALDIALRRLGERGVRCVAVSDIPDERRAWH